jgi:hypothetical protein
MFSMSGTNTGRPTRLWVVGVLDIMTGIVAIAGVFLLAYASTVPDSLRPGWETWLVACGSGLFLVIGPVLTLARVPRAQYAMLAAALIFFGMLIWQNAALLFGPGPFDTPSVQIRLAATVFRGCMMIALNLWVTLGQPTRDFMLGAPRDPNGGDEDSRSA